MAGTRNLETDIDFNYTSQFPGEAPRRETLLRMDYNLTERIRVFGHFIDNQQPTVAPYLELLVS